MEASRDGETVFERCARTCCVAVASGRSCREVASLFGVSASCVVKWSQRKRVTGTAASRPIGGHRKRLLEPHRALVIDRVKAVPDITLKALVAELATLGIATSTVSVWRLVRSEGLRFKKTLSAVEQLRPKIARRRAQWKKYQGRLDPTRLVFIDETWAKTNRTPIRGWAPRAQKLVARTVWPLAHAHLPCRAQA